MAYRIVYGKKDGPWKLVKIQSVIAAGIFMAVALCHWICPEALEIFVSGPEEPQAVLAEYYAGGMGFRGSAVACCASVLECAGYETEDLR